MNSILLFFGKRFNSILVVILICIALFLVQCNRSNKKVPNQQLEAILFKADSLKFFNYETADSLLDIAKYLLTKSNNCNESLAEYYFLKTHINIAKEDYSRAISYSDSSKQVLFNEPNQELSFRLNLAVGMINEMLNAFDEALRLYHESFSDLKSTQYNYEKIIALLGVARINKLSNNDYKATLDAVDSIVAADQTLVTGFYWTHLAFFSANNEDRLDLYKKSLEYYRITGNKQKIISAYVSIIADHLNSKQNDSANFYLNKMNLEVGGEATNVCFETSKARIHTLKAFLYARNGFLEKALSEAESGIKSALANNRYYSLKLLYKLESDIFFDRGNYEKSRLFLERANKYELKHLTVLNTDKIKVAEYQFQIRKAAFEITNLKTSNRIKNMTLSILILSVLASLFLSYIIYLQRKKINSTLNEMRNNYKVDKLQQTRQYKIISSIENAVKDHKISYAFFHNHVNKLLDDDGDICAYNTIFDDNDLKKKIYKIFPEVIESQYKCIVCIYYGFDSKTTRKILNIKMEALKSRKKRLAEKINLPEGQLLRDYILSRLK